jgi:hypothetical protein
MIKVKEVGEGWMLSYNGTIVDHSDPRMVTLLGLIRR